MENLAKCKKAYWRQNQMPNNEAKNGNLHKKNGIGWWEERLGANWVEKRGTRNGSSYVMGRIGDTGPYSPENTKCITNSENGYDRRINGVAARGEQKSNLTEKQVREIYFSTDSLKVLRQRYPVGMGGIHCIPRGSSWTHLTPELGHANRNQRGAPTNVHIIQPSTHG